MLNVEIRKAGKEQRQISPMWAVLSSPAKITHKLMSAGAVAPAHKTIKSVPP
jgi:hypothetical protein